MQHQRQQQHDRPAEAAADLDCAMQPHQAAAEPLPAAASLDLAGVQRARYRIVRKAAEMLCAFVRPGAVPRRATGRCSDAVD